MFEYDHPAYKAWTELGKQILAVHDGGKGPLKALLVISAHWQATHSGTIEVNTIEKNPLVYDYYGFPQEYVRVPPFPLCPLLLLPCPLPPRARLLACCARLPLYWGGSR